VLSGLGSITEIATLQTILRQVVAAVRRFADPHWRAEGLARLAEAFRSLALNAEPGSDLQLAFATSFTSVATSPEDLSLLSGLLDGSITVEGLNVDTDLRWLMLRRLVGRGVANIDAIDAEHDRDRTDAGARHALSCEAALASQEAKETAWNLITSGELPNASFRAALSGFYAADQEGLLAPYARKFFDVIGGVWRDWPGDMAQYFAVYGYPATVVSQQAIDMAADYLATASPPSALRRLITEGRDDVIRALRCRERDALHEPLT
jgi:aminopeptidase N